MDKKTISLLKRRLVNELEGLRQGDDCNLHGLSDSEESLPDLIDRASSFIDRSLTQSFCDRENLRIGKIKEALANNIGLFDGTESNILFHWILKSYIG